MSTASHHAEPEVMTASDLAAFKVLFNAYRDMTPVGRKPFPTGPQAFNYLARPVPASQRCRVCQLPGHQSSSVYRASACQDALLATIEFWWDVKKAISELYAKKGRFYVALNASVASYEMRLDQGPKHDAKTLEEAVVDRLIKNYLKFLSHCAGVKAKMHVILRKRDMEDFEELVVKLNNLLLDSQSLSDLFNDSVDRKMAALKI